MAVVFFTEGGGRIGFGHLSRCQSLADAFREAGVEPVFVVKGGREVSNFLDGEVLLRDWIGDSEIFKKFLSGAEFVVIDSYLATLKHYRMASRTAKCIFVDDFGRLEYPAPAFVLNGSVSAGKVNYPKKEGLNYFLGPKFMPLRRPFWKVGKKTIRAKIRKMLLTFGLNDIRNLTVPVVRSLNESFPDCEKYVVVNPESPSGRKLRATSPEKVEIVGSLQAEKMKRLMLECDVAVSAGGQITYELARVGLPAVLVAVAENQLLNCEGWHSVGFARYVGCWDDRGIISEVVATLEQLDRDRRLRMSEKGRKTVDGQGARRVVSKFLALNED